MDAIAARAWASRPAFVYEKFRSEWSDDEGKVVLDHTPIGDVAEIEGKSRWIDRTARALGIVARTTSRNRMLNFSSTGNVKLKVRQMNMTFRECGNAGARGLGVRFRVVSERQMPKWNSIWRSLSFRGSLRRLRSLDLAGPEPEPEAATVSRD